MPGVTTAHGSHETNVITKSRTHAWCMPCARITVTVCVASNNPTPVQMTAIQNQECERRIEAASICESYYGIAG
jgi:hypothetical protein